LPLLRLLSCSCIRGEVQRSRPLYSPLLVYAHFLNLLRCEGLVLKLEDIYRIRREEVIDRDIVDPWSIHVQMDVSLGELEVSGLVEAAEVEDVLTAAVVLYGQRAYPDVTKVFDGDRYLSLLVELASCKASQPPLPS
jgi:hypothetical protein